MSVFAKPISQIITQDLQELLTTQAVENVRLEFKRDVPSKDETLKKLSTTTVHWHTHQTDSSDTCLSSSVMHG